MTTTTPNQDTSPFVWGLGVRALLGLHDMTPAQLAEAVGATEVTIDQIVQGSRQVSEALRVRIARALKADPYDLFPYLEDSA